MHFFSPEEVEGTFQKAMQWLAPGGRLYIITMSPYHYSAHKFLDTYKKRVQNGDKWPGVAASFMKDYGQNHPGNIPDYLHFLDPQVITRVAYQYGFIIKKMELFGIDSALTEESDLDYLGVTFIKL
jgi:hypothetical protein